MQDDRRVNRTRRALSAAIVELASKRPYESITIRQITEKADIGYATFFRHYKSKDELMLEIFNNVTRSLETPGREGDPDYFRNEGRLVFHQVGHNATIFRSILANPRFARKLRGLLIEHIRRSMKRRSIRLSEPEIPVDVLVHQMAVSVIGLFEWWLEENMKTSIEKMARIYELLILREVRQTV